ncbi:MAG TPA: polysaccharide deacetylase family protein [Pyrinomonadaceae bacterium]|nr:polysaccharide deacetylase family protein [Pyrinomonadaceae bacterium]
MIAKILLTILSIVTIVAVTSFSQTSQSQTPSTQTKTIAERLGYPADAKLLIVHADDLGVAHSVNEASIKAFATGLVKSGSIMIPCSWVPEIAAYAKANPQADLGLHLTLTSEWKNYRWGPLSPGDRVSSLLDESGYLYLTESEAAAHARVSEVETEIRTQIDRAARLGIKPTHLDSHMGTLYQSKELFALFLKVARENKLPVRMSKEWFTRLPYLPGLLQPDDVVLDHIDSIDTSVASDGWAKYYTEAIKNLRPGVTEFVVHIAFDDAEMKAISLDHPNWGAAWRERDFQFLTSDAFRKLLDENNVKLITWRDLRKVQYGE